MDRIRSIVSMARRRLLWSAWLASAWHALAAATVLLALAVAALRLLGTWPATAPVVALTAGGALLALGWSWLRARRAVALRSAVPMLVDERLGSGERLSTALALSEDPRAAGDPFAAASIADAVRFASDPLLPAAVRAAFPVRLPARAWSLPAALAVLVLVWVAVPRLGAPQGSAGPAGNAARQDGPSEEERRLAAVVAQVEANPDLADRLRAELEAARRALDGKEAPAPRAPEDAAREAMRRTAELQARLEALSEAPEAQSARDLRDALAELALPEGTGPVQDLAEALKRGDFESAQDALQSLQQAVEGDVDLSEEERERLASQLGDLASQLERLSGESGSLSKALEQAGMDPALAGSPEALEQALARASQLNESQKAALRSKASGAKAAKERLAKMSDRVGKMCKQCRNPGKSRPSDGAAASEMAELLNDAEAEQQMAMAAQSASEACGNPSGAGPGRSGGAGGGIGTGGTVNRGEDRDAVQGKDRFGTQARRETGERRDGNVIAQQLVAGEAPVGESRVALEEVASRIAPGYERGTEDDPVPAHLREVHKQYFGDLRKRLERKGVKVPDAPAQERPAAGAPAAGPEGGDGR